MTVIGRPKKGVTLADRLAHGAVRTPDGCLVRPTTTNLGYSLIKKDGVQVVAHRVAYEIAFGNVPDGLTIDHLCHTQAVERGECFDEATCRHRACIEPSHLEAVTQRVNNLRGRTRARFNAAVTECPQSHPYDEINTYFYRNSRQCRECRRQANRERKRRLRLRVKEAA